MVYTSELQLAVKGGPRVRSDPWPPRRVFGEDEKLAVIELFERCEKTGVDFGYDGGEEEAYCRAFAAFHGGGFADGVNSGTSALYVALRALEIEPFTEVIVPPITDAGGVMPVPLVGCIPVVADAAPGSFNVGADQIAARITERTSAIVVAHISGIPVDMDPIMRIAHAHGIPVIEDCAQAHGASYRGRLVGTLGDVGVFSTMSGKHHATGAQGGVVYTRDEKLYWRIRQCSDRGKPHGIQDWRTPACNILCSLNLNSNDLAACIGRVQLRKLPSVLQRRRAFADAVRDGIRHLQAVSVVEGPPDTEGAFWFLLFRLELDRLSVGKDDFVGALAAEGLPAAGNYLHLFTQAPWYRNRAVFGGSGFPWTSPLYRGDPNQEYPVPNVLANHERIFRMDMHENLTDREVQQTIEALTKVESAYLKA